MKILVIVVSSVISFGFLNPVYAGKWEVMPEELINWQLEEEVGKCPYGIIVCLRNPEPERPIHVLATIHPELGLVSYAYLDKQDSVVVVGYNPETKEYQNQPKLERAHKIIREYLIKMRGMPI